MQNKVIIEVKNGAITAVYSNLKSLEYVIIDQDLEPEDRVSTYDQNNYFTESEMESWIDDAKEKAKEQR